MKLAPRLALWATAIGFLGVVAMSYFDPHLMRDIADRLWACF